jgi:hypothetical protein
MVNISHFLFRKLTENCVARVYYHEINGRAGYLG